MAIKSVTPENLASYVADKRSLGNQIASHEDVARIAIAEAPKAPATEAKPDPKGVAETVNSVPEPQGENPYKKADKATEDKDEKDNPFAKRIKELTKEKRDLEEFAEGEYNARLAIQRRNEELENQAKAANPKPKVEEDPEPNPDKYTDNKLFLKEWGDWNRKQARKEFAQEQEAERQRAEAARINAELNERSQKSVAAARKDFPDFDEKLKHSPYPWDKLPVQFRATLMESDWGAHVLYGLLEKPDDFKRVLGLRPGAMALELGRLEAKLLKPAEKADPPKGEPPVVNQTRAPAPMPSLSGSDVAQSWDPSKPQPFKEYERRRLEEIRRKARH